MKIKVKPKKVVVKKKGAIKGPPVAPGKKPIIPKEPTVLTEYKNSDPELIRDELLALAKDEEKKIIATLELDLLGAIDINLSEPEEETWWKLAEMYARNEINRVGEVPIPYHFHSEFYTMVKICRDQIKVRSSKEVKRPHEIIEYYWPRPTSLNFEPETVERRMVITERLMNFISKALTHNKERGVDINMKSNSYRTVLAAQNLSICVENYAVDWKMEHPNEQARLEECKLWAGEYIAAHCPIPQRFSRPGPEDLIDPDYLLYRRICSTWGIKPGEYLHIVWDALERN